MAASSPVGVPLGAKQGPIPSGCEKARQGAERPSPGRALQGVQAGAGAQDTGQRPQPPLLLEIPRMPLDTADVTASCW